MVHCVGSFAYQAHAVFEAERAACGERCVFAEAVPCAEAGFDTETLDRIEHHQAGDKRGELRVACVAQFFGIGIEQQTGYIAPCVRGCLFDKLPAFVISPRASHARPL